MCYVCRNRTVIKTDEEREKNDVPKYIYPPPNSIRVSDLFHPGQFSNSQFVPMFSNNPYVNSFNTHINPVSHMANKLNSVQNKLTKLSGLKQSLGNVREKYKSPFATALSNKLSETRALIDSIDRNKYSQYPTFSSKQQVPGYTGARPIDPRLSGRSQGINRMMFNG